MTTDWVRWAAWPLENGYQGHVGQEFRPPATRWRACGRRWRLTHSRVMAEVRSKFFQWLDDRVCCGTIRGDMGVDLDTLFRFD